MKGIILNTTEVKAVQGGASMIVRPVKCALNVWHIDKLLGDWPLSGALEYRSGTFEFNYQTEADDFSTGYVKCPFGKPGDTIYVKEAFRISITTPLYRADKETKEIRWHPATWMKEEESRLTLEVVKVSVKRVQEIGVDDINKSGVICSDCWTEDAPHIALQRPPHCGCKSKFANAWNSRYAKCGLGWDVSPWAWFIEVKRIGGENG